MKLAMLVTCEKVIVDNAGNASLIVLLQVINVANPAETPIPSNAVGPKEWAVASMWKPDAGQQGKELDQIYEILLPDGSSFAKPSLKFTVADETSNSMVFLQMNAIPLGQPGNLTIRSWVQDQGEVVSEVAECSIKVVHGGTLPASYQTLVN